MWKIFTLFACLVILPEVHGTCEKLKECEKSLTQLKIPEELGIKFEFTFYNVGKNRTTYSSLSKGLSRCRDLYADGCADPRARVLIYKYADLFEFFTSKEGLRDADLVKRSTCLYPRDKWLNAERECYDVYVANYQATPDIQRWQACSLIEKLERCVVPIYAELCGPEVDSYVINFWRVMSRYSGDYFCDENVYQRQLEKNRELPRGSNNNGLLKEEKDEVKVTKYDKQGLLKEEKDEMKVTKYDKQGRIMEVDTEYEDVKSYA